jgi:hypothetical protein
MKRAVTVDAPEDVRPVIDGREYPCDVLRDPDQDSAGCAAWVVVPRVPLPDQCDQFAVRAASLPPMSALVIEPDIEVL